VLLSFLTVFTLVITSCSKDHNEPTGNIKILGFLETNISTLVNTDNLAYYYGDFSFDFQRTE
jgi:hypothetical protein